MTVFESVRRSSVFFLMAAALTAAGTVEAADICGATVNVRQIAMTPNADGTRTVRYRATVQSDQPSCARVTFTIIRSYIKPDGTSFEDAIPVEVEVPGRAVDVEAETVANTRRLIYWRAERITCQTCAGVAKDTAPAAAASGKGTAPAPASTTSAEGEIKPKIGPATALIGGAGALAVGGAALVLGGGGSTPGGNDPAPSPSPRPTPAAPTAPPTPTPEPTPRVSPGAPPAAPPDTEGGDISLVNSDPPAGNVIAASRSAITLRFQLYIERVGPDMRLDLQFWSGGEMCLRDTSAPIDIKAQQPVLVQFPMPNTRRCSPPFRTTLIRASLNDRGVPKITKDFPIGYDFVP